MPQAGTSTPPGGDLPSVRATPKPFADVFDRWFEKSWNVGKSITRNDESATDAAIAAFRQAAQAPERFTDGYTVGPNILRATRQEALQSPPNSDVAPSGQDDTWHDSSVAFPSLTEALSPLVDFADPSSQQEIFWAVASLLGRDRSSIADLHMRYGLTARELSFELDVIPGDAYDELAALKLDLDQAVISFLFWRVRRPECGSLAQAVQGSTKFETVAFDQVNDHLATCTDCDQVRKKLWMGELLYSSVPLFVVPMSQKDRAVSVLTSEGILLTDDETTTAQSGENKTEVYPVVDVVPTATKPDDDTTGPVDSVVVDATETAHFNLTQLAPPASAKTPTTPAPTAAPPPAGAPAVPPPTSIETAPTPAVPLPAGAPAIPPPTSIETTPTPAAISPDDATTPMLSTVLADRFPTVDNPATGTTQASAPQTTFAKDAPVRYSTRAPRTTTPEPTRSTPSSKTIILASISAVLLLALGLVIFRDLDPSGVSATGQVTTQPPTTNRPTTSTTRFKAAPLTADDTPASKAPVSATRAKKRPTTTATPKTTVAPTTTLPPSTTLAPTTAPLTNQVPDVAGQTSEAATERLTKAGFTVRYSYLYSPNRANSGKVWSSTPVAGSVVRPNSTVTLQVMTFR